MRQVSMRDVRKEGVGGIRIRCWVMSSIGRGLLFLDRDTRQSNRDWITLLERMYCLITSTIFCLLEVAMAWMAIRRDISSGRMVTE